MAHSGVPMTFAKRASVITSVMLLSSALHAVGVSLADWGVNIDVPTGWVGTKSDDSTYTITNPIGTVQYGVTVFASRDPYGSDSAWVSGTALGASILLEAEPAVIWSMDSVTSMDGLFTYRINYETFYQPTGYVLAGQSRYLARKGVAYELWIMGDTTELYYNFMLYDSIMNRTSFFDCPLAIPSMKPAKAVAIHRLSADQWEIHGDFEPSEFNAYALDGRAVPLEVQSSRGKAIIRMEMSSIPVILKTKNAHWMLSPQRL